MAEYIEAAIFCRELIPHYLPKRNFYRKAHGGHILYCSRIKKNITGRQTENREQRTEKRETNYKGHSNHDGSTG